MRRYLLIVFCLVLLSSSAAWADFISYSLTTTSLTDTPTTFDFIFQTPINSGTFDFAHALGSGTLQDNDNNGVSVTNISVVSRLIPAVGPAQDLGVTFSGPCDTVSCSFDLSNFFPPITGATTLQVEISYILSAHDTFSFNGSTTISNEAPPSVPEPSSLMLLSSGASGALIGLRRRLNRQR